MQTGSYQPITVWGYAGAYRASNSLKYRPFKTGSSNEEEKIPPIVRKYAEKMVDLRAEKQIQLIFVKTPSSKQTIKMHNAVKRFADEHNVPYYAMNEETFFKLTGVDFNANYFDYGYASILAAPKLTDFIGRS